MLFRHGRQHMRQPRRTPHDRRSPKETKCPILTSTARQWETASLCPSWAPTSGIEVASIPDVQPLATTGTALIVDQHGDEHIVERDGDSWITTPTTW